MVALILEDETSERGQSLHDPTSRLDAGRDVIWESREVKAAPAPETSKSTEVADQFGGVTSQAYTQPILRVDLPGTNGAPLQALAFRGGGIKGPAYAGAFRVLETAKIRPGIKRFSVHRRAESRLRCLL